MTFRDFCCWVYLYYAILSHIIWELLGYGFYGGLPTLIQFIPLFFYLMTDSEFVECLRTKPVMIWLVWGIYQTANWFYAGIDSTNNQSMIPFLWQQLFYCWSIMLIVYYQGRRYYKQTVLLLVIGFMIYTGVASFLEANNHIDIDDHTKTFGNDLPLMGCCSFWLTALAYYKNWINKYVLLISLGFSIAAIMIVATRKAFAGIFIILLFSYFANNSIKSFKTILGMFFLGFVSYHVIVYVLGNTYMGHRLLNPDEVNEIWIGYNTNWFLELMGDRAAFYVIGTDLFLESPMTGIGIYNFTTLAHWDYRIHSEYMVQICEGGIIGTIIYICFLKSILSLIHHRYKRIKNKGENIMYIGALVYMFFIAFYAWHYDLMRYFIIYGIIISACEMTTHKNECVRKFLA